MRNATICVCVCAVYPEMRKALSVSLQKYILRCVTQPSALSVSGRNVIAHPVIGLELGAALPQLRKSTVSRCSRTVRRRLATALAPSTATRRLTPSSPHNQTSLQNSLLLNGFLIHPGQPSFDCDHHSIGLPTSKLTKPIDKLIEFEQCVKEA